MKTVNVKVTPKQLSIYLTGAIDSQSVAALTAEFETGFDYYQYREVTLQINSPGGEYKAMRALLDEIDRRAANDCTVQVHAGQVCASAAALVLASGQWGQRVVDRDTRLLFHWVRAPMRDGLALTSDVAADLAKGLATTDQKVLARLVGRMERSAGGINALIAVMETRLSALEVNWIGVEEALDNETKATSASKTEWVRRLRRQLNKWQPESNSGKLSQAVIDYLSARFQHDTLMDLREAYCLALVDIVCGVLPQKLGEVPAPSVAYDLVSDTNECTPREKQH